MNTREAGKILFVTHDSVSRYIRDKKLKATKIKRGLRDEWYIEMDDIEAFKIKYY